jgi:hypothetical protein
MRYNCIIYTYGMRTTAGMSVQAPLVRYTVEVGNFEHLANFKAKLKI